MGAADCLLLDWKLRFTHFVLPDISFSVLCGCVISLDALYPRKRQQTAGRRGGTFRALFWDPFPVALASWRSALGNAAFTHHLNSAFRLVRTTLTYISTFGIGAGVILLPSACVTIIKAPMLGTRR